MKSSFLLLLILFISIFRNTSGWRSQTSTSSVSSTFSGERNAKKEKSKSTATPAASAGEQQLNIGLLAPHTTFGKREYSKAFTSAIGNLQKMRDTKLGFLHEYEFKANNVHFNMIPLTPSPISKFISSFHLPPSPPLPFNLNISSHC